MNHLKFDLNQIKISNKFDFTNFIECMLHFRLKMTDIESQTSASGGIMTQDNTIDGNPRPLNKLENQVETEAA